MLYRAFRGLAYRFSAPYNNNDDDDDENNNNNNNSNNHKRKERMPINAHVRCSTPRGSLELVRDDGQLRGCKTRREVTRRCRDAQTFE